MQKSTSQVGVADGRSLQILEFFHDLQGSAILLRRRVPVFLEGFDFPQVGVTAGLAQFVTHLGHNLQRAVVIVVRLVKIFFMEI